MAEPLTLSRRKLLAGAAALALPGTPLSAGTLPPLPAGTDRPTFHIIDGWVLTSEDIDAMGIHAR